MKREGSREIGKWENAQLLKTVAIKSGRSIEPREENGAEKGFCFNMGEITTCFHADGNDLTDKERKDDSQE